VDCESTHIFKAEFYKKLIFSIIFFISLSLVFVGNALSWDNEKTHKDLSKIAAERSILSNDKGDYLKSIGFNKELLEEFQLNHIKRTVRDWLQEGAFLEDAGSNIDAIKGKARYNNHFHNPLKQWDSAGLNNSVSIIVPSIPPYVITYSSSGESALKWAQDKTNQESYAKLEGDQTWPTIRGYYYNALTGKTDLERQGYFAQVFKGLGHQMHLIQDMAVPAHVRNDAHPEDSLLEINYLTGDMYFETWAKKSSPIINSFAANPLTPQVALNLTAPNNLSPITQFYDTDQYKENGIPSKSLTWGLSEYTNSNFVSTDTIFTDIFSKSDRHYFPYPRYTDQIQCYEQFDQYITPDKKRTYWRKNENCSGEPVNHFVTVGPLYKYLPTWDLQRLSLRLDEKTHQDYTEKLVPRAVGYSAGLLNYFFRGDINLKYESGINPDYVIANNSNENMNGTFRIFYDNLQDQRIELWDGNLALNASSKSSRIDFPIPNNAKEPGKYILVFRGTLGNEKDAVAGRVAGRFLEITPPDQFVYSMIDGSENPKQFSEITAKVKNGNPAEALQNGVIQAIVKFKPGEGAQDFTYLTSEPIPIDSLSADSPREFSFDFSQHPIPVDITDLYLQVVFTGRIGDENNAIATGMKDISEPTPIDVFNNMDRVCINGSWYIAGSSEAIAQVDRDHDGVAEEWDVYPHGLTNVYLKIAPVKDLVHASPDDFMFYASKITAGQMYRAYVLSEDQLNHSGYVTAVPIVQDDETNWDHSRAIMKGKWAGFVVKDQEEYHLEQEVCAQYDMEAPCTVQQVPEYYTFRGKQMWGATGIIFDNPKYPPDTDCSWQDLQ
jgi:hypothetical protein